MSNDIFHIFLIHWLIGQKLPDMMAMLLGKFFKIHIMKIANSLPVRFILPKMLCHSSHSCAYGCCMNKKMLFRRMLRQNLFGLSQCQHAHNILPFQIMFAFIIPFQKANCKF